MAEKSAEAATDILDVAIIGGGPAALAAALYLGRAGLKAQVFERANIGGELSLIPEIANYPGFKGAGQTLADKMRAQAEAAGVAFAYGECHRISRTKARDGWRVKIDDEYHVAKKVLIATGSNPRTLAFDLDPPVSYCALCDGALAKGKKIAVVGGANSAVQEVLYLAPLAKELTLITHSPLKADPILTKQLKKQKNVQIMEDTEPTAEMLNHYEHVFVAIGREPATKFLSSLQHEKTLKKNWKLLQIEVTQEYDLFDDGKYLKTGGKKTKFAHETALKGIFAAGDVRSGCDKQVIIAAGDGAAAAIELIHALREQE